MPMLDFLRTVLPLRGFYYAVKPHPRGRGFIHFPCSTTSELADKLQAISSSGENAFFALARFKEASYVGPDNKNHYRTRVNAISARSAWLDIDCGEGKPYDTKLSAVSALFDFSRKRALPRPTFIVDSGNGVHAYWVFDDEDGVDKGVWRAAARELKAVAKHDGLNADPSRTDDVASVLRPIGTLNYKDASSPKEVSLAYNGGGSTPFSGWASRLHEITTELGIVVKQEEAQAANVPSLNASLIAANSYPDSDANKVAARCATIREMRESKGANQLEPEWRACLGVLAFTEQSDAVCHDWSLGHSGYDREDCQHKIETRRQGAGPTTCDYMRDVSPHCATCKLKCNTPIVLGYPDPEHATEEVFVDETEAGFVEVTEHIPEMPSGMEKQYRFDPKRGGLLIREPDPETEGEYKWNSICSQFPTLAYIYKDSLDCLFYARLRIRIRPGRWETCDIPAAALSQGGQALSSQLGAKAGIISKDIKKVTWFMQTWYDKTRSVADPKTMVRQMGWQDDGSFVLGHVRYMPDGGTDEVALSNELTKFADAHTPAGELQKQVSLIDALYNRPGFEAHQFVLCASLGSALVPLLRGDEGFIGLPISLYDAKGGSGKTTACRVALGLWGDPKGHGQTAKGDATELGVSVMAGVRRHMPILVDEVTDWDGRRCQRFAYTYSDGQHKVQAKSDGGLRDNSHLNWTNIMFITGNQSLVSTVSTTSKDPSARIARVFEVEMPRPLGERSADEVVRDGYLISGLAKHHSHIGAAFIQYVVANQEKVRTLVKKVHNRLTKEVVFTEGSRYWRMTVACTLAAQQVAGILGLFKFDTQTLHEWSFNQLREVEANAIDHHEDPDSTFSSMMSDLQGRLIVTYDMPKTGSATPVPEFPYPRHAVGISGRHVRRTGDIYISVSELRKWCADVGADINELRRTFKTNGWLLSSTKRVSLARGTPMAGAIGQVRTWHLRRHTYRTQTPPVTLVVDNDKAQSADGDTHEEAST